MNKLELLNSKLIEARKTGNDLAKNLLVTMKGEFHNKSKNSTDSVNIAIEKIAKSMIKSANQVGTEDAKAEIVILEEFMPKMLTEVEIREKVGIMIDENPGKPFGFYMGNLMKSAPVDGKVAKEIITELIKK